MNTLLRNYSIRSLIACSCFALISCQSGGSGGTADAPAAKPDSDASVSALSPAAGASGVSLEATVQATFSKDMDPSSLTPASFQVFLGTSLSNQVAGAVSYDAAQRTAVFTPTVKWASASGYTALLTTEILDAEGLNLAASKNWFFQTKDITGPSVVSTSPACGMIGVPASNYFCVEFSEPISPLSLGPGYFTLAKETATGAKPIPAEIQTSEGGRKICLVGSQPFDTDSVYSLAVSAEVSDLAGNPLGAPYFCSFSTVETVKPYIVSFSPAADAVKVPVLTPITVAFSEPMVPSYINNSTFFLKKNPVTPGSPIVPATIQYDLQTNVATLIPASKLAFNSSYTASVSKLVVDLAGNPMAQDQVWSFSTPSDWQDPTLLEEDSSFAAVDVRTAINPTNNHVWTIWIQQQQDLGGDKYANLYARRFVPEEGWKAPVRLSDNTYAATGSQPNTFAASAPQIAINKDGVVFVCWTQKAIDSSVTPVVVDNSANVYSRFLSPGATNWSPLARVSQENDIASNPATTSRLAVATDGTARIAYVHKEKNAAGTADAKKCVYTSLFDPLAEIWSTPVRVNSNVTTDVDNFTSSTSSLRIAGTKMIGWLQKPTGETKFSFYCSSPDASAATEAWLPQVKANTDSSNDVIQPQLAIEPATGDVHALWLQTVGTLQNAYWNKFSVSSQLWGAAQVNMSNAPDFLGSPPAGSLQIAVNEATGKIYMTFTQLTGALPTFFTYVYVRESSDGGVNWSASAAINDGVGAPYDLTLCMDHTSGSVYVSWLQGAPSILYSNQHLASEGAWTVGAKAISGANAQKAALAGFFADGVYNAVAVFLQPASGKDSVWSNLLQQ